MQLVYFSSFSQSLFIIVSLLQGIKMKIGRRNEVKYKSTFLLRWDLSGNNVTGNFVCVKLLKWPSRDLVKFSPSDLNHINRLPETCSCLQKTIQ